MVGCSEPARLVAVTFWRRTAAGRLGACRREPSPGPGGLAHLASPGPRGRLSAAKHRSLRRSGLDAVDALRRILIPGNLPRCPGEHRPWWEGTLGSGSLVVAARRCQKADHAQRCPQVASPQPGKERAGMPLVRRELASPLGSNGLLSRGRRRHGGLWRRWRLLWRRPW